MDVEFDLYDLQRLIMFDAHKAPVVRGTGGLRKLRFAPAKWHKGKSGAVRVCYACFEELGVVVLVLAYAKSEAENFSEAEKRAIRQTLARIEDVLRARREQKRK